MIEGILLTFVACGIMAAGGEAGLIVGMIVGVFGFWRFVTWNARSRNKLLKRQNDLMAQIVEDD